MYKLVKMTSQCWTRDYNTLEEVTAALGLHVCPRCQQLSGTTLQEMLTSSCGREFEYVGPYEMKETLSEAEHWDVKLNGYKI